MRKLEHLFKPISIGTMEVKNRIVMAPMGTNLSSPDAKVSKALITYHAVRARGGVGLIITEDTTIIKSANYMLNNLGLFDDSLIEGWRELTEAVHGYGARIAPQLIHPSFNARSSISGVQPVAASPIASRRYKELPRELAIEEIKEIIEQFGDAARRAKEAGCDAVHLHCAHCHHLLGSFLSPLHNKRTDAYGGSVEARLRITLEVIQDIRSKVGQDFPILIRISGDEFEPGGLTIEHTRYIAQLLEEAGVNAIHVSGGTTARPWFVEPPMGVPPAPNAFLAEAIKKVVDIPVISVGWISTPWVAESVLAAGKADMVAMGRALLADPEFPNKAAAGDWEDIRPCVRDMSCLLALGGDRKVSCMVNPAVGTEEEIRLAPTPSPMNILVIGGGPGGMEAAQIAASRGHKVTLMEKGAKLGGQLLMAAFPPAKQELALAVKYLAAQLEKTGVNVKLDCEATPETVKKLKPDAVVIATGGLPRLPSGLPETGSKKIVTAWDVLSGRIQVNGNVLVIGGGQVGCETADFIAHPTNDMTPGADRVTIMEYLDNVVLDERGLQRSLLVRRLMEKGVIILTCAECVEVLEDGARYRRDGKEETMRGFDAVVLAMGTVPCDPLSEKLRGGPFSLHIIGDARQPRKASDAIAEGWEIGSTI